MWHRVYIEKSGPYGKLIVDDSEKNLVDSGANRGVGTNFKHYFGGIPGDATSIAKADQHMVSVLKKLPVMYMLYRIICICIVTWDML